MSSAFFDEFRRGPSPPPLLDPAVRGRLQQAILEGDPATFRSVFGETCPTLVGEHRLYGVLTRAATGMAVVMVDETGERLGPGYVMPAGIPMHLLNVEFTATHMQATINGEVWGVPLPPDK
jgi:hypothetical protein